MINISHIFKIDTPEEEADFASRNSDETHILMFVPEYHLSWETIEYIDVLKPHMPTVVCPLKVPGDGNCLLHSISVALWGDIVYHKNLRQLLISELTQYESFYRSAPHKSTEDEESQGLTKVEYDKILGDANSSHASLNFIHIFALSNILKRPIVVYASSEDMQKWGVHEEGAAGTFLPTRHNPSQCCGKPITLCWSNEAKNHFVPLCPVADEDLCEWPELDFVFKKTLKPNTTPEDYLSYANLNNLIKKYCLFVEKYRNLSFNKDGDLVVFSKNNEISEDSIIYNYEDDPHETAKKITNHPAQIEKFTHYLTHRREEALLELGLEKVVYAHRKDPRINLSVQMTDYISFTMAPNVIPNLTKKIFQFNEEIYHANQSIQSNGVMNRKYYILENKDKQLLEKLLETLHNIPKLSFNQTVFDPFGLDIVLYMLGWPIEKTWPVIDLIRVLVLQESAATYYSKVKEDNFSLLNIIIHLLKISDLTATHLSLCLKVIINLFRQPVFHISLTLKSYDIISAIVNIINRQCHLQEPDQKIILSCAQVFQNFSRLWFTGPAYKHPKHYDSIKLLIRSALQLLNNPPISDDIKISLLLTLGTIIRNDKKIYIQNLQQLDHLLESRNPTIQECMKYMIECQNNT